MRVVVDAFRKGRTPAECGQDAWDDEFTAEEVGPWYWHFMAARGAGLVVRHVGFRRWEVRPTWFARWLRGNFRIRMVIDCGIPLVEPGSDAFCRDTANPHGYVGFYPPAKDIEWTQYVSNLAEGLMDATEWWLVYTPRYLRRDISDMRAWNQEEVGVEA